MAYYLFPRYREIVFKIQGISEELARKSQGNLTWFLRDELDAYPLGVQDMWTQRRTTEIVMKFNPLETTPGILKIFLQGLGITVGDARVRKRGILKWLIWDAVLLVSFVIAFGLFRVGLAAIVAGLDVLLPGVWLDIPFWLIQIGALALLCYRTLQEHDYNGTIIAIFAFILSLGLGSIR